MFGAECTSRLGFKDGKTFRLTLLKKKAEAHKESLRMWQAREAYLTTNPDVRNAKALLASDVDGVHAKNFFARDVLAKLDKYGSISDKARDAMLLSLKRDIERRIAAANEPPAGPAPKGRVEVEGEVVSLKVHENEFGTSLKCLLKLANGAKIWMTVPAGARDDVKRGDTLKVTVTCEPKADDPSFAFGKRPTFIALTAGAQ